MRKIFHRVSEGDGGSTLKTRRCLGTHHQLLAHANVASKEQSHGVSVEFWDGGGVGGGVKGLYEGDE